ncbi:MAG: Flp pilus assembly protein CpaB [Myxococcota bacterium]
MQRTTPQTPPSTTSSRARALAFLAGSLVLAAFAAAVVFSVIKKSQERIKEASKPRETVDVVIAVRDLYMGLPIREDDVTVRKVVPEMVPPELTFAQLTDVYGRTPRERVLANEILREERLARPDAGIGLNAIVTPGRRAMTLQTDTETGVAGLVQVGNYLDVIVTIKPEDPDQVGGQWVSETILHGIKVLAVGAQVTAEAEKPPEPKVDPKDPKAKQPQKSSGGSSAAKGNFKPSITVELTPEEAEKLAMAQSQGEITVVLRSDIDVLDAPNQGVTDVDKVLGLDAKAKYEEPIPRRREKVEAPPPKLESEVISGGSKSTVTFEGDGTTSESGQKKIKRK